MGRNAKMRVNLNDVEKIQVNDFLRTICTTQISEAGHREATYAAPWTDKLVLAEMAKTIPHITFGHVHGLRVRVYGELARPMQQGRPSSILVERVAAVERAIMSLSKDLSDTTLSSQRRIDLRITKLASATQQAVNTIRCRLDTIEQWITRFDGEFHPYYQPQQPLVPLTAKAMLDEWEG